MKQINYKKYADLFQVKGVKILNDLDGKKSVFVLPDGFICYSDDENGAVSFEKFEAVFSKLKEQEVFSVCIDEFLWIGEDYKLTDNESKKAYFGTGKYSSIHARVAAVYTAVCEGKIKLGSISKEED